MTKTVSLKKQSMYYAVGMVFYLACQWITNVLVTRINLDQGGILTLAIAITNPFSAIALFSMRAYQVSDIDDRYSSGVYVASRLLSMGLAGLLCAASAFAGRYDPLTLSCILLYMGLRLCEALVDVFQGIEQKKGRLDIVGRSYLLRGLFATCAFLIVFSLSHSLPLGILAMILLSLATIIFYDIPQSRRLASIFPIFDKKALLGLAWACLPLTINTFLVSHISALPSITLESCANASIVGIYGALNAPCIIVQTAGSFLFNPLIPQFAEAIKNRLRQSLLRQFFKGIITILAISVICCLGSWILGPWGLSFLFGQEVASFAFLLPAMVLVSGFITLTWFFALLLVILRCYQGLLVTNALALAATHIACQTLIANQGIYAAPGALAIGIAVQAALYLFYLYRNYRKLFY